MRISWACALCGVALIAAQAAIYLHFQSTIATALLCVAAVALAILLGPPREPAETLAVESESSTGRRLAGVALILVGIGAAAMASYQLTVGWERNFDVAAPMMIGGVALLSWGLAWLDRRTKRFTWAPEAMPNWERSAFLAITLLAFAVRFYRYTYFPPPDGVMAVEEPQTGMYGVHILQGMRPWEFLVDRWVAAAAIKFGGPTLPVLRTPFIIFSALTVIPLYLLLRCLVSRGIAIAAATLFAVCHWHIIYARYAHNIFLTTFFVVLVLYLMLRARHDGRLALYPWIGFIAGYTLYAYAGYRGTTLIVALFLGGCLLSDLWRLMRAHADRDLARRWLARHAVGGGIVLLAWAAPLVPLVNIIAHAPNPEYYMEAAIRSLSDTEYYHPSWTETLRQRLQRLQETALIFQHHGDASVTTNLPGQPMLDPVTGTLLALGFCYCALHPRRRHQGYFAAVFVFLLMGSAVFVHNLDVRRMQGLIPIIFVLGALALERVRDVIGDGQRARRGFVAVVSVAVGLATVDNLDVYFRRMINSPVVRAGFYTQYNVAIGYMQRLPESAYLLLLADIDNFFMPNDYAWLRPDRVPGEATTDVYPLLAAGPAPWDGRDLHLLVRDPYRTEALLGLLRDRFPGTACEEVTPLDGTPDHFTGCRIVRSGDRALPDGGLRTRYYHNDETEPFLERVEPFIDFALLPRGCAALHLTPAPFCRVTWEGTWTVERELAATLLPEVRNARVEIQIDGAPMGTALRLSPGVHSMTVTAHLQRNEVAGVRLLWQAVPGTPPAQLPFYQLTRPPGAPARTG